MPPTTVAADSTMPAAGCAISPVQIDEDQRGDQHDVEERRGEGGGGEAADAS